MTRISIRQRYLNLDIHDHHCHSGHQLIQKVIVERFDEVWNDVLGRYGRESRTQSGKHQVKTKETIGKDVRPEADRRHFPKEELKGEMSGKGDQMNNEVRKDDSHQDIRGKKQDLCELGRSMEVADLDVRHLTVGKTDDEEGEEVTRENNDLHQGEKDDDPEDIQGFGECNDDALGGVCEEHLLQLVTETEEFNTQEYKDWESMLLEMDLENPVYKHVLVQEEDVTDETQCSNYNSMLTSPSD